MYAILIVIVLWLVHLFNLFGPFDLRGFGLRPREVEGLIGIFTYPFFHGSWQHLIDNSVPALVLLTGLFSFYSTMATRVLLWSWIMSAVWMWVAARDGNHIGFSGLIYALASFIFFSGLIRKWYRLMALSGVVVFLYGSMVWGVLPIQPHISWEGHLFGAIAGFILAIYFRQEGPQRPKYSWELEEEDEDDESWKLEQIEALSPPRKRIRYFYRPADRNPNENETQQ